MEDTTVESRPGKEPRTGIERNAPMFVSVSGETNGLHKGEMPVWRLPYIHLGQVRSESRYVVLIIDHFE
jgi:hypothetical protein